MQQVDAYFAECRCLKRLSVSTQYVLKCLDLYVKYSEYSELTKAFSVIFETLLSFYCIIISALFSHFHLFSTRSCCWRVCGCNMYVLGIVFSLPLLDG